MKTCIATVSISGTLGEKLAASAAAGFDGIEIFEQDFLAEDIAPREVARMAADHAVGGSMLRLLDAGEDPGRIWDVDFRTKAGRAGAGLTRIEHLAQTTTYDEMLSWSLFYTTLLETEPSPIVDVVDPDGLVRSQAIRSGGLRITLNGAQVRRTLAGRLHEESFGAAVQHIALGTDDIFATAQALAERGFRVLRIGENYYDDLEARFGLNPGFTQGLRAANILYDCDAKGGEFFLLYGAATPKGFFLEICQRRGGYDGYGAANAPFRIAAQKRMLRHSAAPRF